FKVDNRTNFFIYTLDAAATATRSFSDELKGTTVLGVQYYQNIFDRNGASGRNLPPGAVTINAGAVQFADETSDESRTLGAFLEQQIAFRDRLFLTGAVRSDRNSAFGADFKTVFYPKFSASWVLSEEDFFPTPGWMNQLRLRTAYGASGVQPGTTAAVEYYTTAQMLGESGEASGLIYTSVGNRELKPERSTELELGVDGTFFDSRLSTEVTYFTKTSKDQLISRILAPSLGTGSTTRFENLGEVRNWGWEAMISAQIIQTDNFGWDLQFSGSTLSNELISLGGEPNIIHSSSPQSREGYPLYGWDPPCSGSALSNELISLGGQPNILPSSSRQSREGDPLYGWWAVKLLGWEDKNGDGLITWFADPAQNEIIVSDTAEYHGYSMPRREFAVTTGIDLLGGKLRLTGMMDYKGGHLVYNNSERIRCASRHNGAGLTEPNSSHHDAARTQLVRLHPRRSVAGFFEEGDFLRRRGLELVVIPPSSWVSALRARNATISFAARAVGIVG